MTWNSNWSGSGDGWTGASGIQIGYAGEYPTDKYDSFTADPVHASTVNPNQPNSYREPGSSIGDVPINIQGDNDFVDYGMGSDGWVLDDLEMPPEGAPPGASGHDQAVSPARRKGPDHAHAKSVTQAFPAPGWARNFWGKKVDTQDLHAWKTDSTQPSTSGSAKLNARYDTSNWPTPFDTTTVAPLLPVERSTDAIPMRRMQQDNAPLYRRIAVPGANTKPSGSVYNPTLQSNVYVRNITPIPASYTIPTDPAATQDALSQSVMDADEDYVSVGEWA